jgi:hypothetical protein
MAKTDARSQVRYVLAVFLNAAPSIPKPKDDAQAAFRRETQPWYVVFPDEKLSFLLTDPISGQPIVGDHVSPASNVEIATAMYLTTVKDAELLKEAQDSYEYPDVISRNCRVHVRTLLVSA